MTGGLLFLYAGLPGCLLFLYTGLPWFLYTGLLIGLLVLYTGLPADLMFLFLYAGVPNCLGNSLVKPLSFSKLYVDNCCFIYGLLPKLLIALVSAVLE